MKPKAILFIVAIFTLLTLSLGILLSGKSYALTPLDIPNDIAQYLYDYDFNVNNNSQCYATPQQDPALHGWVSPSNQPSSDTNANVNYGSQSVSLEYNYVIMWCRYSSSTQDKVTNIQPTYAQNNAPGNGTLNNNDLTNQTDYIRSMTISSSNPSYIITGSLNSQSISLSDNGQRYWFQQDPLTLDFNKPLTQSLTATINLYVAAVSDWYNGSYICDANGQPTDSSGTGCPNDHFTFSIMLNVGQCSNSTSCSPGGNPSSSPCPLPGGIVNANDEATVNLPNAPQPAGTSPSTPSVSPYPTSYTQAVPGLLMINSAYDQYGQNIPWSPTGWQSSHTFSLNYSGYILDYPYDSHATTINFEQIYNDTEWSTNSSPSYFTCPQGGYVSSYGVCTNTITNWYYASPSYYPYTAIQNGWYCPGGGTLSGIECIVSTYTYTYSAQPWYQYHSDYTYTQYSNGTYGGAPTLPEICPRNFTVQQPTNTDVAGVSFSGGTLDKPNTVTINVRLSAQFNYIYGGLGVRQPMSVSGLSYDGAYYIEHANGSKQLLATDIESRSIGSTHTNGGIVTNDYTKSYTVSMPPLAVGDQVCAQFTLSPEQGQMNANGTIINSSGSVNSTSIPTAPTCSGPILNAPYARFYGNDVIAGTQYDNSSLSCNNNAGIIGNTSPGGVQAIGSGSQFAAMSLGQISNFATAFLRTALPESPNGLTFANTPSNGDFNSSSSGCQHIYNYYGLKPASLAATNLSADQVYDINQHPTPTIQWLSNVGNYVQLENTNTTTVTVTKPVVTYQTRYTLVYSGTSCSPVWSYYAQVNWQYMWIPMYSGGYQLYSYPVYQWVPYVVSYNCQPSYSWQPEQVPVNSTVQVQETIISHGVTGNHVIYVNGNVYIPNNITFGTGSYNAQTNTLSNVPSLYVIAKGNIYIGPNVTKLDGVYVAENKCDIPGSGNACNTFNAQYGGLINTCADVNVISNVSTSAAFPEAQLYSNCNHQLVVQGALVADSVKLERTYASMRNSQAGENPLGNTTYDCSMGNGVTQTSTYGCAAEIFNFDPQNYLAPSDLPGGNSQYDSIVSLPPTL